LNQYGYKIGGPILKDKLFFFTDFDFYNSPQGRSFTRQILTPDAATDCSPMRQAHRKPGTRDDLCGFQPAQ